MKQHLVVFTDDSTYLFSQFERNQRDGVTAILVRLDGDAENDPLGVEVPWLVTGIARFEVGDTGVMTIADPVTLQEQTLLTSQITAAFPVADYAEAMLASQSAKV
jgi:hypothetical protein